MNKKYIQKELNDYINELINNQNIANDDELKNIFPREKYYLLLRNVLEVIKENRFASITTLRIKLLEKSGLKDIVKNIVYETNITPGLVLEYGTKYSKDTIIAGNKQEVIYDGNKFINKEEKMEYDTIFDLASTSKLFTSLSIYTLVDNNIINLEEDVTKYAPEFKNLKGVKIQDLLTFSKRICTKERIDKVNNPMEAKNILLTSYIPEEQNLQNAYTDMGVMVLKCVIEDVTKMKFTEYVQEMILNIAGMNETFLNVPVELRYRCANENYSTIINNQGREIVRMDNVKGTIHDPKAKAIGHDLGIASGHAGYFSTTEDMMRLSNSLQNDKIISQKALFNISNNFVGKKYINEDGSINYNYYYGSLVFLKQPQIGRLSVYYPLSGKAFMSPGFAGTTFCLDPINNISLFLGANRLHNRIYQIPKEFDSNIYIYENGKKVYRNNIDKEKIISSSFTRDKEKLVKCALDLAIEYQFLEKLNNELLNNEKKELHLIREL
jgi:CubicO group peptidase (beta-lactamase class C family)